MTQENQILFKKVRDLKKELNYKYAWFNHNKIMIRKDDESKILEVDTAQTNPDIIVLTETWLTQQESIFYTLKNYNSIHSCRTTKGGGVCIYISSHISYNTNNNINHNNENNFLSITLNDLKINICAVYRKPTSQKDDFYKAINMKGTSDDEKKRRKAEAQRRRRAKIKANPELYERERAKEKERWVTEGKIKKIVDLNRRDKKKKRKIWKESSKNYRDKKKQQRQQEIRFINETTPPPSPINFVAGERQGSSRASVGRKRVRKDRAKAYRTIKMLENKLHKRNQVIERIRKRNQRLRKRFSSKNSPVSKVNSFTRKYPVSTVVKRKLLFHEAVMAQLSNNYNGIKQRVDRKRVSHVLTGDIIKKYKLKGKFGFLTYKLQRSPQKKANATIKRNERYQKVKMFLEKDESSRLCPGKKDTVTRRGIKKQKRLLNKPLKLLHKEFIKTINKPISYSLFCQLRPFWIKQPDVNKRDTCLCVICENSELLVKKLNLINMINENSVYSLCQSLCCNDTLDENCLERKCTQCKNKYVNFNNFNGQDLISYHKWCTKSEIITVSGKKKLCKKTFKNKIQTSKQQLANELKEAVSQLMQHIANRNHQYKQLDLIKHSLKNNEIILHMDYSENYVCKYEKEVQSLHFGGSKNQIVLHTVMAYIKTDNKVRKPFCTFSNSPRKDPIAIVAHLNPVLQDVLSYCCPTTIHFISDGPSTQYRNFKMFNLFGTYFPRKLPSLKFMSWNYSERGHGKGAPDGIGGCIKRIADRLVAHGQDITSVDDLVGVIKRNIKKVTVNSVSKESIEADDDLLPNNVLRFKGTMQTHQVIWNSDQSNILQFRRLSCFDCCGTIACDKYNIGSLKLKTDEVPSRVRYHDVYSSDSDEKDENNSVLSYQKDKSSLPNEVHLHVNSFALVRFPTKKKIKYYVGCILETMNENTVEIKFLRKGMKNCYIYPKEDDIAVIDKNDIESTLEQPEIDKRGHHYFPSIPKKYHQDIC
ncbi:unnamed protein product [Brassicogethes aeneus]|uniref:FP protein C-terminal domain-containing protein n=1 Tax=Brassicogethes aeneus TaxID=1431903 RepID=A0A9P0B6G0_BRAAE|nr:unnamed protein product [Brassicogethes aeneus]